MNRNQLPHPISHSEIIYIKKKLMKKNILEISDEEVDYGSSASNANSDIAPDSSWTPLKKKMIDNHHQQ